MNKNFTLRDYFKPGEVVTIALNEPGITADGCLRTIRKNRDYLIDAVYPYVLRLWDVGKFPIYVGIGDLVMSGYFSPEDFVRGNEKSLEFKKLSRRDRLLDGEEFKKLSRRDRLLDGEEVKNLYSRGIGGHRNNKKQFV